MCYNLVTEACLSAFSGKTVCAAVSGGRDSMVLLHVLHKGAAENGYTLCAVNCDHGIRGKASEEDSRFVREHCLSLGVPLKAYVYGGEETLTEESARIWRYGCFADAAAYFGADFVATAHHAEDNAETVLFNMARGSGLRGVSGIAPVQPLSSVKGIARPCGDVCLVRPLLRAQRSEIERYAQREGVPYVDDETNSGDAYTRNRIRHTVIPALEEAVPGATEAVCRFSRIAAETDAFMEDILRERGTVKEVPEGYTIDFCPEKVLFSRAAVDVMRRFGAKDYTSGHIDALYALQTAGTGRKYTFLSFTACREIGKISVCPNGGTHGIEGMPPGNFRDGGIFLGRRLRIAPRGEEGAVEEGQRVNYFDMDAVPRGAVVRTRRPGDTFTRFGGAGKKLSDWFTDMKIPQRVRGSIPLIASGSEIYAVCGAEISDAVKVTDRSRNIYAAVFDDCARM